MTISTGLHPKLLWPGIHDIWGAAYNEHPMECTDLFDKKSSSQAYEEEVEMSMFGLAPVKGQGTAISFQDDAQGVVTRSTHVAYALGYVVTHEELQDNLYEKVSKRRSAALGFSMRQTKETVAANYYNGAFTTTLGGDGVAMISASHPTRSGTNFSNILTVSADLSEASLEDLCIQIANATNSMGQPIALRPKSLHIASANMFEAQRILKSTLQSDSANNAINALNSMGMFPGGAKINHYFTDADAFFVRTDIQAGGMTLFQREEASFSQDNDFDTKNAKAAAYERYSFTFGDPRAIFGSAGG